MDEVVLTEAFGELFPEDFCPTVGEKVELSYENLLKLAQKIYDAGWVDGQSACRY